jgi:hypothetical protein
MSMKAPLSIIILVTGLLSGCVSGDFNYGPAEYLHDKFGVPIQSIHPDYYEWFYEGDVEVVRTPNLGAYCGHAATRYGSQGCYVGGVVYVAERASEAVVAHEMKHARGWCHYQPLYEEFWHMSQEAQRRELKRAQGWFPCEST